MKAADLRKATDLCSERDMIARTLSQLKTGGTELRLGKQHEFIVHLTPAFQNIIIEACRGHLDNRLATIKVQLTEMGIEDA